VHVCVRCLYSYLSGRALKLFVRYICGSFLDICCQLPGLHRLWLRLPAGGEGLHTLVRHCMQAGRCWQSGGEHCDASYLRLHAGKVYLLAHAYAHVYVCIRTLSVSPYTACVSPSRYMHARTHCTHMRMHTARRRLRQKARYRSRPQSMWASACWSGTAL